MKDALIVLGMGGPSNIKEIRPFLYNIFSDTDIINFHIGKPLQKMLAIPISYSRAKKVTPKYLEMDSSGKSPQLNTLDNLLDKVSAKYESLTGIKLETLKAMCYLPPFISETMNKLKKSEYRKTIFLPLYPQFSMTTTGACLNKLTAEMHSLPPIAKKINIIPYWYYSKLYCKCIAKRIKQAAAELDCPPEKCHVVFSAHSIPESYVKKGDIYLKQLSDHVNILAAMLGLINWEISYQSKTRFVKWVSPSTESVLQKLAILNINNVIIVPISFISDHIETLIELDKEIIPSALKNGIKVVRTKSLNDDNDFVEAVTDIIIGAEHE